MHLLVLSAFRHQADRQHGLLATVSMHLLVLSAFRRDRAAQRGKAPPMWFQCTFWCSVLSDLRNRTSMAQSFGSSFNAPSGAQCFPTERADELVSKLLWRFNAPSGAQCFPT